jgi:hypothetical protein
MIGVYRAGQLLAGATVFSLVTLGQVGVAQAESSDSAEATSTDSAETNGSASRSCAPFVDFRSENFHRPTTIDNKYLPMVPGTRLTYRGTVSGGGQRVNHEVVFTVTDLVKDVAGVRNRVIYDVDKNDGEVTEAELAFFAQDDKGIVWNLGEYPEEFEGGKFIGAPNVWIAGLEGASGGIHMLAAPEDHVGGREYLQGKAPKIDFLDCARVAAKNGTVDVPAGHFSDVLTTYERSPLESTTAIQTKEHAPGVGIVRIGAKNDPQAETLELISAENLGQQALSEVDAAASRLDEHGHEVSDVYRKTPELRRDGDGHVGQAVIGHDN